VHLFPILRVLSHRILNIPFLLPPISAAVYKCDRNQYQETCNIDGDLQLLAVFNPSPEFKDAAEKMNNVLTRKNIRLGSENVYTSNTTYFFLSTHIKPFSVKIQLPSAKVRI
jgi:hypothetical protein